MAEWLPMITDDPEMQEIMIMAYHGLTIDQVKCRDCGFVIREPDGTTRNDPATSASTTHTTRPLGAVPMDRCESGHVETVVTESTCECRIHSLCA